MDPSHAALDIGEIVLKKLRVALDWVGWSAGAGTGAGGAMGGSQLTFHPDSQNPSEAFNIDDARTSSRLV